MLTRYIDKICLNVLVGTLINIKHIAKIINIFFFFASVILVTGCQGEGNRALQIQSALFGDYFGSITNDGKFETPQKPDRGDDGLHNPNFTPRPEKPTNTKLLTANLDIATLNLRLKWSDQSTITVKLIHTGETNADCIYEGSYNDDPER